MTKSKTAFQTIARSLDQLTDKELQRVADMALALVEAREDERVAAQAEADRILAKTSMTGAKDKGGRGHIELKTINGCGPYKYLRFWEGKVLRSQYIGKA